MEASGEKTVHRRLGTVGENANAPFMKISNNEMAHKKQIQDKAEMAAFVLWLIDYEWNEYETHATRQKTNFYSAKEQQTQMKIKDQQRQCSHQHCRLPLSE